MRIFSLLLMHGVYAVIGDEYNVFLFYSIKNSVGQKQASDNALFFPVK